MVATAGTAQAQPRAAQSDDAAEGSWNEGVEPSSGAEGRPALVVFGRARADYQAARYRPCSALLTELFERSGGPQFPDPGFRDEARHYAFACALLGGDAELAEHHVNAALRENPAMEDPDAIVFRPQVVERFIEIRVAGREARRKSAVERVRDEEAESRRRERLNREQAAYLEELKAMAREERTVYKNERWMAAVPFGVGQFQNRSDALGWFFLTSEVLLAGTLVTGAIVEFDVHAQNPSSTGVEDAANRNLAAAQTAMIVGGWGFLAMAVIGIVEAQASFVPEFEGTPDARELPDHLENLEASERPGVDWHPTLRAGEDGAEVGVVLSF